MDLLETTIALARKSRLDRAEICREIGVTVRWYQKVLAGQIPEPSVVKIQRLHDYLVEHADLPQPDAA